MFLILALVAAGIGYFVSDGGIGDTPFAQLTLNKIFTALFSSFCYLAAVALCGKSLEHDQVWPWRWSYKRRIRTWLSRGNAIRNMKHQIRSRRNLGYDTDDLQKQLNELLDTNDGRGNPAA